VKQGRPSISGPADRKVEPIPKRSIPGPFHILENISGTMPRIRATSLYARLRGTPVRGYSAPAIGSKRHKTGSQGMLLMDYNEVYILLSIIEKAHDQGTSFLNVRNAAIDKLREIDAELDPPRSPNLWLRPSLRRNLKMRDILSMYGREHSAAAGWWCQLRRRPSG